MSVVWITGGGTGIGKALAKVCWERGDHVAISGRRAEMLDQAAQEIALGNPTRFLTFAGDVTNADHAPHVVRTIQSRWGDVDVLINNAGSNNNLSMPDTNLSDYREALEINCLAAIQCTQVILPAMQARKSGGIVNISSIYGRWASSHSPSYSVAKYAVAGYTHALRQSLVGSGIHVLGVYPGFIRTDMTMPHVKAGSFKARLGAHPESLAKAILRSLSKNRPELCYPSYVSGLFWLHRWFPGLADRIAVGFRSR